MILNAVMKLYKTAVIDRWTTIIFVLVAIGGYMLDVNPVVFVVLAALAGIVLSVKAGEASFADSGKVNESEEREDRE